MINKYYLIKYHILISIIICILLTIIAVQTINAEENSNLYHIQRKQAVIKVDLQNNIQKHDNKSMELRWNKKAKTTEDLKFKLSNHLYLINDDENNRGINSLHNNDQPYISKEDIKVKINGNTYNLGNGFQKVLDKDIKRSELKFIVNKNQLRNLPAGKYRANIDSNITIPGKKPFITVHISEYFNIGLSDEKIEMVIDNPTKDKTSNSIKWTINTNCNNYNIRFESVGPENNKKDLTDEKYRKYFRYQILEVEDTINEFIPGKETNIQGIRSGDLRIYYSDENSEEQSWHELGADEYNDTVIITVSAENE